MGFLTRCFVTPYTKQENLKEKNLETPGRRRRYRGKLALTLVLSPAATRPVLLGSQPATNGANAAADNGTDCGAGIRSAVDHFFLSIGPNSDLITPDGSANCIAAEATTDRTQCATASHRAELHPIETGVVQLDVGDVRTDWGGGGGPLLGGDQ